MKNLEASSGGKFNQSKSKSDIEWTIHHAKQKPGPGTYMSEPLESPIKGGRISVAKVKSDIDWKIMRASQVPGPGEYKASETKTGGGSFNTAKPKTDLEWKIHFAQKSPGPGEYKMPENKKSGGSFSTANPKSDLEWKIFYAQKSPGAGEYNTTAPLSPSGGKFNTSKSKSDLEWTIHKAKQLPGPGEYRVQDAATRSSSHSGKFPFIYAPTDPEHAHLAKGTNAIVKMNRQKKIVMAMMDFGGPVAGGKKSLKEMTEEERKAWEKERDEDVQKTRDMLARLDVVQKKRRASLENGGPLPPLNSHLVKKPSMAALLKRGINSGKVEDLLDGLEASEDATPAPSNQSPTQRGDSLLLEIPTPPQASIAPTPEAEPKPDDCVDALKEDKGGDPGMHLDIENSRNEQEEDGKKARSGGRYCFESHNAEWVDSLDVEKLSAGGFSSGNLLHSLKAPPNLQTASLLLYKLGQKVALDSDKKAHGFNERSQPPHVNYYRMFKEFDLNDSGDFTLDDFTQTIRRVLGIDSAHTSNDEIAMLFNEMNTSGKTITLAEFAAFARGAEHSISYHTDNDSYGVRVSRRNSPEERVNRNFSTDTEVASHRGFQSFQEVSNDSSLDSVHLVLWRLAQHCASEMDAKSGGRSEPMNPASISYSTMFAALDLDKAKRISREEWVFVLRSTLGVGPTIVSDKDLHAIYDTIHSGHEKGVTLAEFAAFARGARESTFARGAGFVWEISEQDLMRELEVCFDDMVVLAPSDSDLPLTTQDNENLPIEPLIHEDSTSAVQEQPVEPPAAEVTNEVEQSVSDYEASYEEDYEDN